MIPNFEYSSHDHMFQKSQVYGDRRRILQVAEILIGSYVHDPVDFAYLWKAGLYKISSWPILRHTFILLYSVIDNTTSLPEG